MLNAFPKIYQLGDKRVMDILSGDSIEITEKIDGSQFVFGKIDDTLYFRSKGAVILPNQPPKMFRKGVEYIQSIEDQVTNNVIFYCEYLNRPQHNVLKYERVPTNNLMLYAVELIEKDTSPTVSNFIGPLGLFCELLEIEKISQYKLDTINIDTLSELLKTKSVLGNVDIEGIVIKNYSLSSKVGELSLPILSAKLVSEKFREVQGVKITRVKTKGQLVVEELFQQYKSTARWEKAVQHLKEKEELKFGAEDIGLLIKEIHRDIEEEEKENIKEQFWEKFHKQFQTITIAGFPQWYKQQLLEKAY